MIAAQIFGRIIQIFGQPKVLGEMISGVLLGPTLFGFLFPSLSSELFPKEIMPALFILSNIGLSFYMFIVGSEIDYKLFNKSIIKQAGTLSLAGTIIPFFLGILCGYWYFDSLHGVNSDIQSFSIFMGTALAITAFPMLARILHEKKLINSKIGILSLLAACVQDVVSWILLAFVTGMAMKKSVYSGYVTLLGAIAFIAMVFLAIRPWLKKISSKVEQLGEMDQTNFSIVIILLLLAALVTDYLGLYSVFGGFILGLAMPRTKVFQAQVSLRVKDIMIVMFLPIFFAFSGLNTNLLILKDLNILVPCVAIITFAIVGKYVICTFSMKLSGFNWRESSAIGGLINARGLMELLVANIGLSYSIINKDLFSILILMAIITTLGASPIYNYSMRRR